MKEGTEVQQQVRPERRKPVVLICPLNWGLGHAARCVPVVRAFLNEGCQIVVAAEGGPLALLKNEFSETIEYCQFPGMNVRYSGKNMVLNMARQLPALLQAIWKEHRLLKKIVQETKADVVVSDNRYGLWHRGVRSVFVTHQVFIQLPLQLKVLEPVLYGMNRYFMKKYDHCWVPDFRGEYNLSGLLSHKKKLKGLNFVGPLSRFASGTQETGQEELLRLPTDYFLVILSGPEPQRSLLEQELIRQFDAAALEVIFVRGKIGEAPVEGTPLRTMLNHASTPIMKQLIANARLVVCRPGYSTLMDLAVFGKKALVIPTPGQTEQEYLGRMLHQQGSAACVVQDQINLSNDLVSAGKMKGIPGIAFDQDQLQAAVQDLLKKDQ